MRRFREFPRWVTSAVLAGVAALLLASSLPHRHADGSSARHAPSACQLCRIQQQRGAAPVATGVAVHAAVPIVAALVHVTPAPRAVPFLHASAPRSPPAIS